ncbi:MAG: 4a-hydroxytetrahydrobiopterin dehydratase [Nocardioidaceae bacterium]
MALLEPDEVDRALATDLPQWTRDGDKIWRNVTAPTFLDGIALIVQVARAAEEADHHPDIDVRWTTVTFTLSTHSEGGITEKDLALAAAIDRLT